MKKKKHTKIKYTACKIKGCRKMAIINDFCDLHRHLDKPHKSYKDYYIEAKNRDANIRELYKGYKINANGFLTEPSWSGQVTTKQN